MLRKLLAALLLVICLVPAAAQDETISQWASWAAASSEYGEDDYSAMQATGEPDTEECGNATTAWASESKDTEESLTLFFDEPVIPTELNIYQNYNPGAIVGVALLPEDGSWYIVLEETADEEPEDCPWVFTVDTSDVEVAIIGVELLLDQSITEDWNEIDAVELIGYPVEEGDETEEFTSPEEEGETDTEEETTTEETTETTTEETTNVYDGLNFGRGLACDDGGAFNNGLEFTIAVRTEATYTITALGLNDFDPVLWVARDNGTGPCNDDSFNASVYGGYLPTAGTAYQSNKSAQVEYYSDANGTGFENITIVVGGQNDQAGDFMLIVEGLTLTYEDNQGDPIWAYISPSMIESGTPLTAYMLSVTDIFDPWIGLVNSSLEVYRDGNKNPYSCDDAGYTCWGQSYSLEGGYYVSRTQDRILYTGWRDAMLTIPLNSSNAGATWGFLLSTIQGTSGDYVLVFHAGVATPQ